MRLLGEDWRNGRWTAHFAARIAAANVIRKYRITTDRPTITTVDSAPDSASEWLR
jgi:hypothetical protein